MRNTPDTKGPIKTDGITLQLSLGVLFLALLHLVTARWPSVWTWGVDYWSVLPVWGQFVMLATIVVAVVPGNAARLAALVPARAWQHWTTWAGAVAALALFMIFRSKGFSYGDAYSFREYFLGGEFPSLSGNLALMSGDLAVHWLTHRALVMPLGGTIEITYSLLSALAGVASLAAIVVIAKQIYPKDRGSRWTLIAAAWTSGMALIWFGHVEAYSLVGAGLLWSIAMLVRGRTVWAWGFWALACAFHLLAVAFLPVLVLTQWGNRLLDGLSLKKLMLLLLAGFVGWGVAASAFGLVKPGIFVTIINTDKSSYSAFSIAHLADTLNLLLFVAPVGLLGLLTLLKQGSTPRTNSERASIIALGLASASLWYFAFWVDPLIGAFRDWDLIGAFGIPLSLLGAILLLPRSAPQSATRPHWIILTAFAIVHTGGFVLTVQDELKAMDRVDRLVREDVHYSRDFHKGERLMSWAFLLAETPGRKPAAIVHLSNRSQWEPRDLKSWANLGSLYWQLGHYDSAATAFEKALKLDSTDSKTYEQLAFTYSAMQNWKLTSATVEKLASMRAPKPTELNLWAYCLIMDGNNDKGDSLLNVSLSQDPNQQEAHYYKGIVYERRKDTANALASYEQAMLPQTNVEDVYLRCARLYQGQQRWSDAERVATAWMTQFPNSANPPFFVGICRIATQQYAGARDALERAASLDPNSALTQFYLATAYRNLGQTDRALASANRAAAIDPSMALPYLEMVYLAADRGDHAAAVAATNEYLKRSPSDSGMAYLQQFMEP